MFIFIFLDSRKEKMRQTSQESDNFVKLNGELIIPVSLQKISGDINYVNMIFFSYMLHLQYFACGDSINILS